MRTEFIKALAKARLRCPNCKAKPGQKCIGVKGQPRSTLHMDRYVMGLRVFGRNRK